MITKRQIFAGSACLITVLVLLVAGYASDMRPTGLLAHSDLILAALGLAGLIIGRRSSQSG